MNVLDQIFERKKQRVEEQKKQVSLDQLKDLCACAPSVPTFSTIFEPGQVAIIAEMKRQSPSAGVLLQDYDPRAIAKVYQKNGARALSVLTEQDYFGGELSDLTAARMACKLPILRKDFMFDSYQIYEARAAGASAVLLIMAMLGSNQYSELLHMTEQLGLEALVEVHDEKELMRALMQKPKMIGINNRNLKDLTIDLDTTFKLHKLVAPGIYVVSESGIKSRATIESLQKNNIGAALIGESILRQTDYGAYVAELSKKF